MTISVHRYSYLAVAGYLPDNLRLSAKTKRLCRGIVRRSWNGTRLNPAASGVLLTLPVYVQRVLCYISFVIQVTKLQSAA